MKSILLYLVIFITLIFYSCDDIIVNKNSEPMTRYFHVKVDTLVIPDSVSVSDTLIANLKGTIGPSGCFSFSNLEVNIRENEVSIKVIGKEKFGGCIAVFIGLNEDYKMYGLNTGYLYLEILNPENQIIRDSVLVY